METLNNIQNLVLTQLRRVQKYARGRGKKLLLSKWYIVAIGLIIIVGSIVVTMQKQTEIDARSLLSVIAKGESRGNYNAYFGNVNNTDIKFTEMTVQEVIAWQKQFVQQGQPSSAVGKYQFIQPTLEGLVKELDVEPQAKFDEQLQDSLAKQLLERRGLNQYMDGEITPDQFAHNLSKEWAALPKVLGDNPTQSYYAGDGLNAVQITIDEVKGSITSLSEVELE